MYAKNYEHPNIIRPKLRQYRKILGHVICLHEQGVYISLANIAHGIWSNHPIEVQYMHVSIIIIILSLKLLET